MDHGLVQQRPNDCTKEQVMRPARPSSPRNQDVSYVLSNVFGDLYSEVVLHDDTIINLETSRTGDPDFHDYYVQLLNEIRTERKERLESLDKVEEHMMSAFNLAKEQNMAVQDEQVQPNLGIPERHVGLSRYIDGDMLAKYNLLTPGSYLRPSPPSIKSPTLPDLPNFMRNTEVMEEHERARMIAINREVAVSSLAKIKRSTLSAGPTGNIKIQAPIRNAWKDSMNPDVRIEEQKGLEKLQAKSHFLKTKRFCEKKEEEIFCTVPSQIHFDSYEIGKSYEQKIKVKNMSTTSRQLKVLPPRSKYFTITKTGDPSQNGAVAPGLSTEYTVTFLPESLGRYDDEIQIIPQGGSLSSVPLIGERPPPVLSLPETIDCGYCLVHGTLKTKFSCKNSGGHGIFQLYPQGSVPEQSGTMESDGFTVTPTSFELDTGDEVILEVEFKPDQVARSNTMFTIAADNCTEQDYTLTAEAQKCRVQIIAISGGESTVDYDIRTADNDPVSINFDDQNPGTTEYKMFIVRNCINVALHYNWEICKILSEPDGENKKQLLSSDLNAPFFITPDIGILDPSEEATFTINCNPKNTGKYLNVARLWVDDIPSLLPSGLVYEKFDALRISLSHLTQPHEIKLEPPALVVPGERVIGMSVTKNVKIVNNSLSDTNVKWVCPNSDLKFTISPETLTVGAGSSRIVEIDIESTAVGNCETHLMCVLENVEKPIKLFVKAKFRGPKVTIEGYKEDPALDFGFIHFRSGCSVQRQFEIVNHDGVTANWSLAEIDHCVNKDYGQSEFQFSEDAGEIGPYEVRQLHVTFKPHSPRSLKSFIECQVEHGCGNKIRVVGEIQEPNIILKQSQIDLGIVYVGVPVNGVVVFESLNFADSSFVVCETEGQDKQFANIEFDQLDGVIYAGATQKIPFKFTGREPAKIQDFTVAFMMAGDKVLAVGLKAEVRGLQIVHETPSIGQIAPEAEQVGPPLIDFGTINILNPTSRVLKIINKSHIATHFSLEVVHFKGSEESAQSPPPLTARGIGNISEHTFRSRANLLTRSQVLLDPKAKSRKQSDQEFWKEQLSQNKGACFIANPSTGYLPGNGVTIVTIHGNTDMWGDYTDTIISHVGDMDPVHIPIKLTATSSPLFYKLSNNSKPTVRFGSYPLNEEPVTRTVNISNQGPVDIRLDWETYNTVPVDATLVDLNFFVGDAFPLKGSLKAESNEDEDLIRLGVSPHEGELSDGPFIFAPDQCTIPARGTSKVTLTFHPNYGPGQCQGDFHSFALAYQSLDRNVDTPNCTRLFGEKVEPLKIMMTGKVEVPEVIVTAEEHGFTFKLMAGIINSKVKEHTKIHKMSLLNSSKLHLNFEISSSFPFTLLTDKLEYSLIPRQKIKLDHGFILSKQLLDTLLSCSKQHFKLLYTSSGSLVEDEEGEVEVDIEEKILNQSHEVKLSGGSVESIVQKVPEKRFHLHSFLTLHYKNGHDQRIPVHARVILPTFYISPQTVNFGTCLVGQTSHLTVRLINPSNSPLRWSAQYAGDNEEGTFEISPKSGEFTRSDGVILNIKYMAITANPCNGTFTFTGTPGNRVISLQLSGHGSFDERMQRLL